MKTIEFLYPLRWIYKKLKQINLGFKVILIQVVIFTLAGFLVFDQVVNQIRPGTRQVSEDILIEVSNAFATYIENGIKNKKKSNPGTNNPLTSADIKFFSEFFTELQLRQYQANIYSVEKSASKLSAYITDHNGIVIYDSNRSSIGLDYSQWNDVYLTLQGKYGARSTWDNPKDESTSRMYVAAPIKSADTIVGVVTVSKSNQDIQPFIELAVENLQQSTIYIVAVSIFLGGLLVIYLTRSIRKLVGYTEALQGNSSVSPPALDEPELRKLEATITNLTQDLVSKGYLEQYVHALTHELKSPLSGIKGAAEILESFVNDKDGQNFLKNIQLDSERMQEFIEKMLMIVQLDSYAKLEDLESIDLEEVVKNVINRFQSRIEKTGVSVTFVSNLIHEARLSKAARLSKQAKRNNIEGNPFLLEQALENILDNAFEFSINHGAIKINLDKDLISNNLVLEVVDSGTGIPEFARDKIFDRYFSLPRPSSNKRSSGLGLALVKRVVDLHQGRIDIGNRRDSDNNKVAGCKVVITFPIS